LSVDSSSAVDGTKVLYYDCKKRARIPDTKDRAPLAPLKWIRFLGVPVAYHRQENGDIQTAREVLVGRQLVDIRTHADFKDASSSAPRATERIAT